MLVFIFLCLYAGLTNVRRGTFGSLFFSGARAAQTIAYYAIVCPPRRRKRSHKMRSFVRLVFSFTRSALADFRSPACGALAARLQHTCGAWHAFATPSARFSHFLTLVVYFTYMYLRFAYMYNVFAHMYGVFAHICPLNTCAHFN